MRDPRIDQLKELLETECRVLGNRRVIPAVEVSNMMPSTREEAIKRHLDRLIHEFAEALPPLCAVEAKTAPTGEVYIAAKTAVIPYAVLETIVHLVHDLVNNPPQPPKLGPTERLS